RQDSAAIAAMVGEDGAAGAFGKARGPCADRRQAEPPVILQLAHLRAERVEMGNKRECRESFLATQQGPYGTAARDLERNTERPKLRATGMDDIVRISAWARNREQALQDLFEIGDIYFRGHIDQAVRSDVCRVWGNSRSIK